MNISGSHVVFCVALGSAISKLFFPRLTLRCYSNIAFAKLY